MTGNIVVTRGAAVGEKLSLNRLLDLVPLPFNLCFEIAARGRSVV
jgi:hypothetical protein